MVKLINEASQMDRIQYLVDILNDMYGLDTSTDYRIAINGAYGKAQLVLKDNDSGAVRDISGFVSKPALYEIVNSIYNIKNRLG